MTIPKLITCKHLQSIESAAHADGLPVAARGNWWEKGEGNNIYFGCVLNRALLEKRFQLPAFVGWYEYDGRVAGHEAGFHCKECNSLLVGGMATYGGEWWPKS